MTMDFTWMIVVLSLVFFVLMLGAFALGRRIGIARLARDPEGLTKGAGAAEGSVFALMGLLLAFTFSGAASRMEDRRWMVNTEANAIGTAWLRLDLLPAETQVPIRDLFRRYVENRASMFENLESREQLAARRAEAYAMQAEIWKKSVAASQLPGASPQAAMLLIPALNEMIDITGTRKMSNINHPPPIVFILLISLSLIGGLLVGYATSPNRDRSWFHQVTFALVTSLAIYVILDLEYPRLGLIKVDAADQALVDLGNSMK